MNDEKKMHIKNNINWVENFINHPEEYQLQIITNVETVDEILLPYVEEYLKSQGGSVDLLSVVLHKEEQYICFLVSDQAFSIVTDFCTDDEADYFISNKEAVSKSIICVMGQLQDRIEELEKKFKSGDQ